MSVIVDKVENRWVYGMSCRSSFVRQPLVKCYTYSTRSLLAAMSVLLIAFVAGCGNAVVTVDTTKPDATVTKIDAGEAFSAMADAVERQTIMNSQDLADMVTLHRKNGWLEKADSDRFEAAFPTIWTQQDDFSGPDRENKRSEVAAKLRSLK